MELLLVSISLGTGQLGKVIQEMQLKGISKVIQEMQLKGINTVVCPL